MRPLVAVDWGTTFLRVARLDAAGSAREERELPRGILSVEPGGFAAVFQEACGDWMQAPGALALICGMAGSRQGWMEAPYAACPAGLSDVANQLTWVEPDRIAIVPGLMCTGPVAPDVMRGEETQTFGALQLLEREDAVVVLPGTHSKWVRARRGRVESFATFMTGEFFSLLRRHSILARTLDEDDGELDDGALRRGVDAAMTSGNLLHAAFSARTLALVGQLTPQAGSSYLSGLLIGEELRSRHLDPAKPALVLTGSPALVRRYGVALAHLGIAFEALGQESAWQGLAAIARCLQERT
ncbi:2-dehydro-3-deoxygalactonokinase [Ramlibacter solisilvae]|uniref:2-dehydro-3-deoxygalactonokinase n=1 Tax=Ramlibacter tataouinensis TaxID=94132 RepID=A0A127JWB8_9BURK|nr:2-dehydro-3-deoxygalactonokinase [Ramlibacter tataouinensis]AMO24308.1 2-dehydro-3-deoxygalactonokinase [Ramlibacter tataouinensis]